MVKQVAEGDRQRLQEAMNSMFVKASDQDMGAGPPPPDQVGLRQPNAAAAKNTSAAAAVLAGFGDRFASAGAAAPQAVEDGAARAAGLLQGGLYRPSSASAPSAAGAAGGREEAREPPPEPQRWSEDWRPDPLVCKRFNVPDPYKGKPQVRLSSISASCLASDSRRLVHLYASARSRAVVALPRRRKCPGSRQTT